MTLPTFRHFCASSRVLDVYLSKDAPVDDLNALCRRLQQAVTLSLRTQDVCTPDHQHRQRQERVFAEGMSLSSMLLKALGVTTSSTVTGHASTHGLEYRHGAFYVCADRMEEWQQEVTAYQSPVPVLAAAWVAHCKKEHRNIEDAIPDLCAGLRCSSLPGIYDPRLHRLIHNEMENAGCLCDLHVHINGSTEFTQVWLHSLLNIDDTYIEIEKAAKKERVQFFFSQLRVDAKTIRDRLHKAACLRSRLCRYLTSYAPAAASACLCTVQDIHTVLCCCKADAESPLRHPFVHPGIPPHATELQREGAMWLRALQILDHTGDTVLAMLLHTYLLLMHQHLRLLVHQPEQFGFDQFQYITLAGAREAAEHPVNPGFVDRFGQFQGPYAQDMAYVEARFAPKKTLKDMQEFLVKIWSGYLRATGQAGSSVRPCPACPRLSEMFQIHNGQLQLVKPVHTPAAPKAFALGLVVHFIKSSDDTKGPYRHRSVRELVAKQARALISARAELTASCPDLARALVGKDAASNEQDAPPEVFAPVFRQLNRAGISHSTFHAGEDFEHILCGIRAVYEAVDFLDMGSGDRIGHATALGLDPGLCTEKVTHCRKGQWLDTLVWLTRLLDTMPQLRSHAGDGFMAQTTISTLYREIYQTDCPDLPVLWKAWELRRFDPRLPESVKTKHAVSADSRAEQEALHAFRGEAGERLYELACKEFEKYHKRDTIRRWNETIVLDAKQHPSHAFVRAVQDCVIMELCRKNIAVEVLPTSNVRISHYHATEEHHGIRWLCPDDARPAPQVVLGTDDPGIFSTTLRNEYAFILKKLQHLHPGDSEKPYEIIRHLIENGMSFRFA